MSLTSATSSRTASATASASSAAAQTITAGSNLKVVGIVLAISSGLLIGSSFVFKKKGLLRSQAGHTAGEGVAYLKSPLWWLGMTMMIMGEICNFAAYAFVEAIVVTPLGALSVVICAILSSIFLKEQLTFFGWLGCGLCILGSIIIAMNGPKEASIGEIQQFKALFLFPSFLVYMSVLIAASLIIIFYFAPKYGRKSMFWYIFVCSMIGGISVSVTTGLGAAIVQTALGNNQFKHLFIYFLLVFVVATLLTEVYYLNMALALFNTAMVTPTYYVIFTFFSMLTTVVLFQGLKASAAQILTIVMAFLVICVGITILQMSKIDPTHLTKLDRKSTILLQAARRHTESLEEKSVTGMEDPGIDAIRGSFGSVGSIIRARSARRMSQSSGANPRSQPSGLSMTHSYDGRSWISENASPQPVDLLSGMKRHQLWDPPVPENPSSPSLKSTSLTSSNIASSGNESGRRPTIKFDNQALVHSYLPPGTGDDSAIHEHRSVGLDDGGTPYPPIPATSAITHHVEDSGASASTIRPPPKLPISTQEEMTAHSAPPTVSPRYSQALRPDARNLFHPPLPSSMLDEGDGERKSEHGRSQKRYPKGVGEDDREESTQEGESDLSKPIQEANSDDTTEISGVT